MTVSNQNETHSMSTDDKLKFKELTTPLNYESRYQRLLEAIREYAATPQPSAWVLAVGSPDAMRQLDEANSKRDSYFWESSLLATQLVHIDLGSLGIAPAIARLIVLARLQCDSAPINDLRNAVNVAIADVIESLTAPPTLADTLPGAAKPLFTKDMWILFASGDAAAPTPSQEAAADLSAADFAMDKLFSAMPTMGAA
jgi:hypothetical protein